ncbi:MAG: hypothetical protein OHK0039_27960 [Bacteroidia bacterium]
MLWGCGGSPHHVRPAFYHWKSSFAPAVAEYRALDSLGVKRLYVRFFDVDWSESRRMAVPVSSVVLDTTRLRGYELVPTLYLTNRTLLELPDSAVSELVQRMTLRIAQLAGPVPYREVQIDCDWTARTRERYFLLLDQLRAQLAGQQVSVSATIRLHQVKYYAETGVPPVQRGMLMCYNMGEVRDPDTRNSIIDPGLASAYLSDLGDYPLPLDVALPVYAWGVVVREGRAVHLLHQMHRGLLADTTRFTWQEAQQVFVKKSTYLSGYYLYAGDLIRWEEVQRQDLEQLADLLADKWTTDTFFLTFYHLDTLTLQQHPHEELEAILQRFR